MDKDKKVAECAVCTSPKLPNSDYCEWCQSKIDSYVPDEKEEEHESMQENDKDD